MLFFSPTFCFCYALGASRNATAKLPARVGRVLSTCILVAWVVLMVLGAVERFAG